MKLLRSTMFLLLLITASTTEASYNYANFRKALWLSPERPLPHAPRAAWTLSLWVHNYWQPNMIINWVAVGDENTRGNSFTAIQPGDDRQIQYIDGSPYGPVWISVSFPGPPEDPNATRALYILDSQGFKCKVVSTEGVYRFDNLFFGNLYGDIWADVGDCN